MTWVMGQPIMFGYSICLADIQVTFDMKSGEETEDCLRKIYKIDQNLVVGFAGSVDIGFTMLNGFARLRDLAIGGDLVFEPDKLVEIWPKEASQIFRAASKKCREKGSKLLIAGVSHSKDLGIPGFGKPVVATLSDPEFEPRFAEMGKWLSIGKGRGVKHYQKILKNLESKEYSEAMRMETAFPSGYGSVLGVMVGEKIKRAPEVPGISKHLHVCIVSRRGVSLTTTDHCEIGQDGRRREFRMPNVATSWKEFQEFCKIHGYSSTSAVA